MLKIAIDTQPIHDISTDFGLYAPKLVRSLERIDRKHEYLSLQIANRNNSSLTHRWWWDQFGLPSLARQLGADLLHRSVFSAPRLFKGPVVATIHDLSMFHFPKDPASASQVYPNAWLKWSYRFADRLIVMSEDMKQYVTETLKISEDKLTVIYPAADLVFRPIHDADGLARVRKKYGIGSRFLLHMNSSDSRANLPFLLQVLAAVKKKVRTDWQLVIVGRRDRQIEQILEEVRLLGLEHAIVWIASINTKDKPLIYNAASILVHPSLYDGAGLVPLEAMSCGVPVVGATAASLPEIIGNGGILLSPIDTVGWTKALVSLMTDASLRREYGGRAKKQARRFSWERTARETVRVYDQVYREHLREKRLY